MKSPKPLPSAQVASTAPKGAQLQTREKFLYGKFETMIKPAFGSGIVSSFFLFNDAGDFKSNWCEADFEFLGRHTNSIDLNVIKTIAGVTDKNINVTHNLLPKRSADVFWKLALEWLPGSVTWKINDVPVRMLNVQLNTPMKLIANIWIGNPVWAGVFSDGLLPQTATYEYVRVSSYENGQFVLKYQDSFNSLDENRWLAASWQLETTTLAKENVSVVDGKLILKLI